MRGARLAVRDDLCIACGLCERLTPDLFVVIDHKLAVPLADAVNGLDLDRAHEAADACPTEAIYMVSAGKELSLPCEGGE